MSRKDKHKTSKKSSKKRNKGKIIAIVLIILAVLVSIPTILIYKKLSQIKTTSIGNDLGIDKSNLPTQNTKDYVNILLLGVDARDVNTFSRSDSMMIATIDKKDKTIKLTSLMRDTLVNIDGHGQDRLGHTYAFGKGALAVKTVNENFNMDIQDYIVVNFFGLEKIIDYLGGVGINVQPAEISVLNDYVREVSGIEHTAYTPVTKSGYQILNGKQAVGYCRIRYVGNEDFERTERQRTVLSEVIKKLSQENPIAAYKALDYFLPDVETSLSKSELLSLGSYILVNKINTVEQFRLPADGLNYTTYINNVYFLGWNKDANIKELDKFIYGTSN